MEQARQVKAYTVSSHSFNEDELAGVMQAFEGIVIRKKKGGTRSSFTVRKMSFGVGVERIFPLHSPRYETIEVLTRGSVARNRLFYLRGLRGKAAKVDVMEEREEAVPAAAVPNK